MNRDSKAVEDDRSSVVRTAGRPDAKQLSSLAEATFRDTFEATNAPETMALHCRTGYGEAIQATEIADPDMVTLVCESQGTLVGFAQLRWGESPSCVVAAAPREIQRLYVAREFHGLGVARQLGHSRVPGDVSERIDEMRPPVRTSKGTRCECPEVSDLALSNPPVRRAGRLPAYRFRSKS